MKTSSFSNIKSVFKGMTISVQKAKESMQALSKVYPCNYYYHWEQKEFRKELLKRMRNGKRRDH